MKIISVELAELYGMHAGDGTIYRTQRGWVYELRGGKDEKDFYDKYVVVLFRVVFEKEIFAKERAGGKNGCYGIRICNKKCINEFIIAGFL